MPFNFEFIVQCFSPLQHPEGAAFHLGQTRVFPEECVHLGQGSHQGSGTGVTHGRTLDEAVRDVLQKQEEVGRTEEVGIGDTAEKERKKIKGKKLRF